MAAAVDSPAAAPPGSGDLVHATSYANWVSIQTCSKGLVTTRPTETIHLSRLQSHFTDTPTPAAAAAPSATSQRVDGDGTTCHGQEGSTTRNRHSESGEGDGGDMDGGDMGGRAHSFHAQYPSGQLPGKIPGVHDANVLIYVDRELAQRDGFVFEPAVEGISADDDGNTVQTKGFKSFGYIPKAYFSKVVDKKTGVVLWENDELKALRQVEEKTTRIPRIDIHTHILPSNLDLCKEWGDPGYIFYQPVAPATTTSPLSGAAAEEANAPTNTLPETWRGGGTTTTAPSFSGGCCGEGGGVPSRQDMMKILPDGKPPEKFRQVSCNCYHGATRVEEMDDTGVDVQVLSTVPVMFSYWQKDLTKAVTLARYLNDDIAAVVGQHPKRYVGLGTLPLQFPDAAVDELTRCMTELGFKGVQIGSHVDLTTEFDPNQKCWELSDPALLPFWRKAEELGAAIFVHPWDMMGSRETKKYWLPWLVGMPAETSRAICHVLFSSLLDHFPKLRVCFAHGGGSFPFTLGRIDHGLTCRPDICVQDAKMKPVDYVADQPRKRRCRHCELDVVTTECERCGLLCNTCDELLHSRGKSRTHSRKMTAASVRTRSSRFWVDSLVHDSRALDFLIDVMGEDRVVLGSDYPFPLGEWHPGQAICRHPSATLDVKRQLLCSNACQFLGIRLGDHVHVDKEGYRIGAVGAPTMRNVAVTTAPATLASPAAAAVALTPKRGRDAP